MPIPSETCQKNTCKSLFLSETLDFSCVYSLYLYSSYTSTNCFTVEQEKG